MTKERPVSDKEFKAVLSALGFARRSSGGSSHEQWVRDDHRGFYRVTVDSHHAPYHRRLLRIMLVQAGTSKADFFEALSKL
jgi:predicted RNA binding protein YcfA (HicA-like mRNA interferase family)